MANRLSLSEGASHQHGSYEDQSVGSYLLRWLNPIVETGVERQLSLQDSPELAKPEDTLTNTGNFVKALNEEEQARRRDPLIRALLRTFWRQLLIVQTLSIMQYLFGLLSPFLLKSVLLFQEAQNSGEQLSPDAASRGFSAVAAMVCLSLFLLVFNTQVDFFKARVTLRMSAALRGSVVCRGVEGLTRSPGEDSSNCSDSAIYNVISFDTDECINMIWTLLSIWLFPFQLVTVLAALYSQVALSFIPGLIVIVLFKSISMVLGYYDGVYRDRLLFAKDERLERCSESFRNIRVLQMLAWTPAHQTQIAAARSEELRCSWIRLWLQKIPAAYDYGLTALVTLITLGYYVTANRAQLKASLALPVISLIGSLIGPLSQFPTLLNQYTIFRSAYDRFDRFMGFGQKRRQPGTRRGDIGGMAEAALVLQDCCFSWSSEVDDAAPVASGDLEEASLRQPLLTSELSRSSYGIADARLEAAATHETPSFELHAFSMELHVAQTLIVVAQEGQGKSSLLLGFLGEMPLKSGKFTGRFAPGHQEPAVIADSSTEAREALSHATSGGCTNPVAFAPQEPWFFSGSVRENVLFGLPLDQLLFDKVMKACQLEADLATMPAGELTQLAAGGSTISGGQRARLGLARAAYSAKFALQSGQTPLVLLDDPFCSLDRAVASQVCKALLSREEGLLGTCTIVVATADPWWQSRLQDACMLVLRAGQVVAQGQAKQLCGSDLPELQGLPQEDEATPSLQNPQDSLPSMRNPQDEDEDEDEGEDDEEHGPPEDRALSFTPVAQKPVPITSSMTQTPLTQEQEDLGSLICTEGRESGHVKWSTYMSYLDAVGHVNFSLLFVALAGIMIFQNFCNLWIVYWTSANKRETFVWEWVHGLGLQAPVDEYSLLYVYACLVFGFYMANFAGHGMEIIGGIRAARLIFNDSLDGTLSKPFRWWDTNPTGRVLNRFSGDVEVMDKAVTNIFGVIIGAVLYFVGHTLVLTLSSPISLCLLPVVAMLMEYFAQYYRNSVRELQRLLLTCMSDVFQEMTDAIMGGVTVRAFCMKQPVVSRCLLNLQDLYRASFIKQTLGMWIGLRMGLVGSSLSIFNNLYPIFQYYGLLNPRSAALVGFSITYSTDVVNIIKQFIMNFSDMEMQLISIERLCEYAKKDTSSLAPRIAHLPIEDEGGLVMTNVEVTYRPGLPPALSSVTLSFAAGEAVAVMGRTGAGKSSLLLAILQLVPYKGDVEAAGQLLRGLDEQVRAMLVAVVPQQPVLFTGTLRWNLDPNRVFSDAELWEVIRAVGLERSCGSDRLGLQAEVKGSKPGAMSLSQGQKQLLCAARALLCRPRVALLDEVTANLPPDAAANTVETLLKRFTDIRATTLLVTHQENLVSFCDRVVRLRHGRVESDERIAS